ncbi:Phenoloxidase-activating factor 2 [Chionoecetes opilio]|uniref:Phenoloxidase-activating factor 2 n=1 Tax=Chionoecetes opilio TaxID=41210 RepID=A0A8J4XXP4_CHIOP|nr:Phenoloxidase-activating factor 2 [Chionoecetes opilio]
METFPHPPGSEMNELLCGGSLIHERVVLTAAHCILAIDPHRLDNLEVALGAWDTKEGWLAQVRQVTKVVHHHSYKGNTLQHNMALLLLNQSVEVTSHVKPICLGPVQSPSSCVAVGWSKTGDLSNIKVPVLDRETCEGCLKNMNEYEASAICPSLFCTSTTGFHDKSSGSPLLCKDPADGNYWQSGVLVSQLPCTQAFYVNATQELDWITRETSDLIHYGMTLHNLPSFAAIMETFPHPPGLEMNELLCGGSLIHERVVLTAAHCVLAIEPHRLDNLEVALGAWDTKEGWFGQVRQVTRVVRQNSCKGKTLKHNMALLLLNQSVEVTSHVKPICLGPVKSPSSCVAVGWSKTGDLSNIKVPVLDRETCEGCLKNMNEDEASAICPSLFCTSTTGFHDKSSGSPLLCKDPADGNYWQSGVLVSQLPCTQAFYVNVTRELDWITRETSDLIHYGMVP